MAIRALGVSVIEASPVARRGTACVLAFAVLVGVAMATVLTWSQRSAMALACAGAEVNELSLGQLPVPGDSASSVTAPPSAATRPVTFPYDVDSIARVDVHRINGGRLQAALHGEVREWSASPPAHLSGASTTPVRSVVATKGAGVADDVAKACLKHSFRRDAEVLMADGSRKPIGDVEIGDKVLATDPVTGRTAVRTVTALHRHTDTDLAEVTVVDADGDVSVIHTTQHHPFWNVSDQAWEDAGQLDRGDRLRSNAGQLVRVVAVRAFTGVQWMYDLTVDDLHTYYVAAGDEPVLVHNCFDLDALSASGRAPAEGGQTAAGRAYQKHMGRGELPQVPGSQLSSAGQNLLDDILTAAGTRVVNVTSGNFAGGVRYIRRDGVGVTFHSAGRIQYFGVGY